MPPGLPAFLEAASRVRAEAGRRIPDDAARARFWTEMGGRAFASPPLRAGEWESLLLAELAVLAPPAAQG